MGYDFWEQLKEGKKGEYVIDQCHTAYDIKPATDKQDRTGFDRIFIDRKSGKSYTVEIKTCFKAQIYGNIIIETVSKDTTNVPGWAITSQSDILIFYLWHLGEVLYFQTQTIKDNVYEWEQNYPKAVIPNDGWNTIGIKLPLPEARKYTFAIREKVYPEYIKDNHKRWLNA